MDTLENRTFAELEIGASASLTRRLTRRDIELFAIVSGDVNPAHLDDTYASHTHFAKVIAHGMWGGALISTVLGTELPGPGTIYLGQTLRFHAPVVIGEQVTVTLTVSALDADNHHVTLDCVCTKESGERVISGQAVVLAPQEKIRVPRTELPQVRLVDNHHVRKLMQQVDGLPVIRAGIVHPVTPEVLEGAVAAAEARIIEPVLIGPEARIREAASRCGVDISRFRLVPTPHSHAAADRGVELVRAGELDTLVKGSLHTDEFMAPVLDRVNGLRTDKRISHVFLFDVPTYDKPLLITDAVVNIAPNLEEKAGIVQNAIDFARAIDIDEPRVAILSAVETVTPKIESTLHAAALCKMADRGQIRGGILDGPLAFDNAISTAAAQTKGIESAVAGQADILLTPDMETGNMLAKQLEYLADASGAGVLLGASVPIILTSRADSAASRVLSCALVSKLVHQPRPA